jgi:hypothetical protein
MGSRCFWGGSWAACVPGVHLYGAHPFYMVVERGKWGGVTEWVSGIGCQVELGGACPGRARAPTSSPKRAS